MRVMIKCNSCNMPNHIGIEHTISHWNFPKLIFFECSSCMSRNRIANGIAIKLKRGQKDASRFTKICRAIVTILR